MKSREFFVILPIFECYNLAVKHIINLFIICLCLIQKSYGAEIKIATLEWPPFASNKIQDQTSHGTTLDKIEKSFASQGVKVEFIFVPWARAVKMFEANEVDALAPVYFSQHRVFDYYFSEPIEASPLIALARQDFPLSNYHKLSELYSFKFGVVRDYANTDEFDRNKNIRKEYSNDDFNNLKKLDAARVDLILIDKNVYEHLLKKHKFHHSFKILSPSLEDKKLHLSFPKKSSKSKLLLEKFNNGLLNQ